jgi:cytochrome P450
LPKSSFRSSLQIIDGFVNPFIDQALSTLSAEDELDSADKYTFLHALSGFTRDRKVLRDQIVAILLAGRDTTAAALSWTFYELARHPQIVRTLRREILEVVGFETLPTYEHLKSMRYLQASCTLSHFNTNYGCVF